MLVAAVAIALAVPAAALAQKIVLTAELDASQEVGLSTSPATGEAVMHYDLESNTFSMVIRIRGLSEPVAASHIHEALPGVNGPVAVGLGGEDVYKRSGDRLRLSIKDSPYIDNPEQLLTGGAYVNVHTPSFPAGAIRGQLLPHSAHFIAHLTPDQEVADVESRARGIALVEYSFLDDTVDAKVLVVNFKNVLRDSHIHEAPRDANGPVVVGFGGAAAYHRRGNTYFGCFSDLPYTGKLMELLRGNAYVNIHSDVYPGGEIRGQLRLLTSRCRN